MLLIVLLLLLFLGGGGYYFGDLRGGGIGIGGVLLIFVVLYLCGVIQRNEAPP